MTLIDDLLKGMIFLPFYSYIFIAISPNIWYFNTATPSLHHLIMEFLEKKNANEIFTILYNIKLYSISL